MSELHPPYGPTDKLPPVFVGGVEAIGLRVPWVLQRRAVSRIEKADSLEAQGPLTGSWLDDPLWYGLIDTPVPRGRASAADVKFGPMAIAVLLQSRQTQVTYHYRCSARWVRVEVSLPAGVSVARHPHRRRFDLSQADPEIELEVRWGTRRPSPPPAGRLRLAASPPLGAALDELADLQRGLERQLDAVKDR